MDAKVLGGGNPAADFISIHSVRKANEDPDGEEGGLKRGGAERGEREDGVREGGWRSDLAGLPLALLGMGQTRGRGNEHHKLLGRTEKLQGSARANSQESSPHEAHTGGSWGLADEREIGDFQSHKRLRDYYLQVDASAYKEQRLTTSEHRHVVNSVELGVQAARVPPVHLNGVTSTAWALNGTSNGTLVSGGGGFNIFTRADCRDVDHAHAEEHCKAHEKLKEEVDGDEGGGRGGVRMGRNRGRRRVADVGKAGGLSGRLAERGGARQAIWVTEVEVAGEV